jgi:glycosyltransferase involved in cell wall biosynthesis
MKTAFPILHLTESLTRLGGVEIFVNDWVRADANSAAAALLDSQQSLEGQERRIGLRPSRLHSLNAIRERIRHRRLACATLICHNFAGLTSFSDLIAHERLVVCLHTNSADVWPRVRRLASFVDGFITGGKSLAEKTRELLGGPQIVVASFESPLDDSFFRARRVKKNGRIQVGFAGRLVVEQKRVDRLKEFCEALLSRDVDFHLQITGDGPERSMLGKLLAPYPVDFLGTLPREKVAETFAGWDFQIITSDYETGPAAALEGMACGTIPILPEMECQVRDVLGGIFGRLLYPVGQMQEAAARLQDLSRLPAAELETLRSDLRGLVASKSMANHLQATRKILGEIHAKPSLRKKIHFQTSWKDHLPLAVRCRWSGNSEFLK